MTFFSIIVPVFNDERYLVSAVKSILHQKYSDYELIIINDASTDNSGLIADKFSVDYSKVKVIHNESNAGVAASRNSGLSVANGDYIIFLDSDDMLIGDCLNGLTQIIKRQPDTELIVGRWVGEHGTASNSRLFEDTSVLKSNNPTMLVAHINSINYQPNVCWHYVIKRKLILEKRLQFRNVKIAEDQEFVAKLLCLVASVAYFDHPFYLHRGTGRLSKSMDLLTSIGIVEIIKSLGHFLKDNNQLGTEQKRFILSVIRNVSGMLAVRLTLLNEMEIEEIEEFLEQGFWRTNKLHDIFRDLNLLYLIDGKRREGGLLNLKQQVENKVLSIMHNVKHSELYIFCASIDAFSMGSILRKNGYQILGLVDNNPALNGTTQDGFSVYGPEIFSSKVREDNRNCIVIVCNPSVKVFDDIVRQLVQYGLREENIKHSKQIWCITQDPDSKRKSK